MVPIHTKKTNTNILALFNIVNHTLVYLVKEEYISTNTKIVEMILRCPECRQTDISELVRIPLVNISMALGRMQGKEIVTLKRNSPPKLTKKGQEYYVKHIKELSETIEGSLKTLNKKDRETLKTALVNLSQTVYSKLDNEDNITYAFFDVHNYFNYLIETLVKDMNEFYRMLVLMYLAASPFLTSEDIRTLICVNNVDTLRILFSKMEKSHLIKRSTNPDLRSNLKQIEITEEGRIYYKNNRSKINESLNELFSQPDISKTFVMAIFNSFTQIANVAQKNILPDNTLGGEKK